MSSANAGSQSIATAPGERRVGTIARLRTRSRHCAHSSIVMAAVALLCALILVCGGSLAFGQDGTAPSGPHFSLDLGNAEGEGWVGAIKIMLLLGSLTLAPTLLLSVTSFTRIVIVLSLLRQAVGVVQLPPNRVVISLALFLTLFTMAPVWSQIEAHALAPLEAGQLTEREAMLAATMPLRDFMLAQTREEDLALMVGLSKQPRPESPADLSTLTVVPAFMLSELKAAFQMGALLFLPFLVIDLVVASVLMSMGMMMLPPMSISLPLKLIVFVMVDGWGLVLKSLAESFVS